MLLFVVFCLIVTVRGQLSIDELFYFESKHAVSGNCTDLQYTFVDIRIGSMFYNQLEFDCDSSSMIFRNQAQISTTTKCPKDEREKPDFQLRFDRSLKILTTNQTLIHIKRLHLNGIDLSSLDDLIRNVYREHSNYHSRWALLIDIENENNRRHHLALATDGEKIFLVCILLPDDNPTKLSKGEIEIIFSNEHIFGFNRSSIDIWRIDQGFVHYAQSTIQSDPYQLSKTTFSLYNNETFLLYGINSSYPRRVRVTIDSTPVECRYQFILSCIFPILPFDTSDTHRPRLKISYNYDLIVNTTLSLIPRRRLVGIPEKHNLTDMTTFKVKIDENLCSNHSLKSWFTFIIHMQYEDVNGTRLYRNIEEDELGPVDCGTTLPIGQYIRTLTLPISIDDILWLDLDLTHQWFGQDNCRIERTRVHFVENA